MLLTVDVRNTNIVLGLFSGTGEYSKLLQDWRMRTDPRMTADELALTFRGLLGTHVDEITGVAALSTVPSVLREIRVMLERYWGHVPHVVVEPGIRTGVPLLVDNPKEVGADRIVNSLAAHHLYEGPCIVVDFGTSTCVDVVSAKGEFLGGCIAPGLEILDRCLGVAVRCAAQGRIGAPAFGGRQEHRRMHAVRCGIRLCRPR